jgi:chromosome segregation ATPase
MSEVKDLVMPFLQRMQADLADVKRDLTEMKKVQAEHTEKFEEIEIYLAYATGLASQNKADVQSVKAEIRTIKQRLEALELRP